MTIEHRARPAAGEPEGLLVLFHGRGADENDLFPLLDLLDPERRLLGITPQGPLSLPPGGAHWYAVYEIGHPDPGTFLPTYVAVSNWLDALAEETGLGPDRTVLGGFSQGAVMSFALALARPQGTNGRLTDRERDVLKLLAEGLQHEEIGRRLGISGETVRTHVQKACDRLGASTRTQAVATALRQGLIA